MTKHVETAERDFSLKQAHFTKAGKITIQVKLAKGGKKHELTIKRRRKVKKEI